MNILTESIIKYISGPDAGKEVDIADLDRTSRNAVVAFVRNGTIFDQDAIKQLESFIVDSIMKHGVDTRNNKILAFIADSRMSKLEGPQALSFDQGALLLPQIESTNNIVDSSGEIRPFANSWLFDPRTYEGDIYKIKALILLSDEDEAKKYNPTDDVPLEDILNAKTKQAVEKILSNWAVADGDSVDSSSRSSKSTLPESKEDWVTYLKKAFPGVDTSRLEKAAAESYRKGRPMGEALVDFVAAMVESFGLKG